MLAARVPVTRAEPRSEPISIRPARHAAHMWLARIRCSGPECEAELELVVGSIAELDGVVCEGGYGHDLLALAEVELV